MGIRVVSFYTNNTIYEQIMAQYLMPCLKLYNLSYHIFALNNLGTWKHNVRLQPSMILMAMKAFPNDNILWMDADTTIRHYPELFLRIPERSDMGVYYMDWEDHYGPQKVGKADLVTGVMYIKNTPKMVKFIEEWVDATTNEETDYRFKLMHMVDSRIEGDFSIFLLPRTYAYVATRMDGSLPAIPMIDPIVVQHQASKIAKENLHGNI